MPPQPCQTIFGIGPLSQWMGVSEYRVRRFLEAGMPAAKIQDDRGCSQWLFHARSIDEWAYNQTLKTTEAEG